MNGPGHAEGSHPRAGQPDRPRDDTALDELVPIGTAAVALGVSVDTLRRWERAGKLLCQRRGNRRYLATADLTRLLRERSAKGVTSARNRLPGVVVAVKQDGVMAQIDMVCGQYRVVSLMSREAAEELRLRPGRQATAVIKATTVIIETR